ncbi:hypothetical protein KGF57_004888 [Candida theae]|uniref:Uncharacterized protein n=1 Tax=Candida theae TaxID=1198502 RepID=A0AAD5BB42_9ASCO|nr:uncharacterized protein KGF57_004888 [Candida theae]KAI5949058.1 hypothetical protein KGF57_004888 [Candida theae]
MSDELGKICDDFLEATSILSHEHGIPRVQKQEDFTSWSRIHNWEKRYYTAYQELTHKLNRLMYLTKLKELANVDNPSQEVAKIKGEMDIDDLDELLQFLRLQNDVIKTDTLLNRFLLMSSPVLKAIHHANLNTSETKITDRLGVLYNENGLAFRVQELENKKRCEERQEENPFDIIYTEIKPLMEKIEQSELQFKELQIKYVSQKKAQVEENEGARKRYQELVERWHKLDQLSLLLILLITSLPYVWSNDESLMTMMLELNGIRNKLMKYQLVVNKDDIKDFSTQELLTLEFD